VNKADKGAVQGRARAGKPRKPPASMPGWRRVPLWLYILSALVIGTAIGIPLYLSQQGSSSQADGALSPGAASGGDHAPAFALQDQTGELYNLNLGDGKNHLLVFYMGNF
jgi:hypothetical protein